MKNPHEVLLGVSEGASEAEIRRSYRKLVRRHHPDLNPGNPQAEERFKEIQQAYESLMNESKKHKEYGQTSPRKPRKPSSETVRSAGELSDFLKRFGVHRTRGYLREMSEEDISRLLKRFGIDASGTSRIRVSFGDSADFGRPIPSEEDKDLRRKPPPFGDGDLKRPPKPPKPPKW